MGLLSIDSKKYQYLLIYWSIALVGSNLIYVLGAELTYLISFVLFAGSLLYENISWRMERDYLAIIVIFFGLCVSTMVLTGGDLSTGTTLGIVSKLLVIYSAIKIDTENFAARFVNTVFFMASISLILWLGYMVLGTAFSGPLTKVMYHNANEETYGLFIAGFNFSVRGFPRNAYIFGEPGKFQIIVNGALYFLLFKCNEFTIKRMRTYTYVLIATIITAMSTEGYFILLFIFIGYMLRPNKDVQMVKTWIIALVIMIVYTLFFANDLNPFAIAITDKVIDENGNFNVNQNSSTGRVNGLYWYPEFVFNNPLRAWIGVGASSAEYGSAMGGILGFYFTFGIINSTILHLYLLYKGWISKNSVLGYILAVIILVFHGVSQPDTFSTITCFMLLYSGANIVEMREL